MPQHRLHANICQRAFGEKQFDDRLVARLRRRFNGVFVPRGVLIHNIGILLQQFLHSRQIPVRVAHKVVNYFLLSHVSNS
ncbi:MAG: hypothetical protein HZC38_12995 [Chloroflexi bacterium]|nr:hypothetical protein [Chloroflexota bacterium]